MRIRPSILEEIIRIRAFLKTGTGSDQNNRIWIRSDFVKLTIILFKNRYTLKEFESRIDFPERKKKHDMHTVFSNVQIG